MRQLLGRQPLGQLEVGALGVGDREQPALGVLLVRDTEQVGGLLLALADQVQRGPGRAKTALPQRQHVAPDGRKQ